MLYFHKFFDYLNSFLDDLIVPLHHLSPFMGFHFFLFRVYVRLIPTFCLFFFSFLCRCFNLCSFYISHSFYIFFGYCIFYYRKFYLIYMHQRVVSERFISFIRFCRVFGPLFIHLSYVPVYLFFYIAFLFILVVSFAWFSYTSWAFYDYFFQFHTDLAEVRFVYRKVRIVYPIFSYHDIHEVVVEECEDDIWFEETMDEAFLFDWEHRFFEFLDDMAK